MAKIFSLLFPEKQSLTIAVETEVIPPEPIPWMAQAMIKNRH